MAEAEIARDQTLMNRGVPAVQTLERAQQERDQAAAAVDLFARQLEDYTVSSPRDGTVMKRDVEVGETVAANAVMFEISSTARKRIAADVDERDIAGVKLGAALAAHADGFPDEAFEARVTNIRRQGDASSRGVGWASAATRTIAMARDTPSISMACSPASASSTWLPIGGISRSRFRTARRSSDGRRPSSPITSSTSTPPPAASSTRSIPFLPAKRQTTARTGRTPSATAAR